MANTSGAGSSWMGGEILPIIPLSCLWAGGCRVFAHLESQGAGGGRVVDLSHGGWHVIPVVKKR
ncbi:hypothetical protein Hanom_Chr12g01085651 [Helianthus anomalus]